MTFHAAFKAAAPIGAHGWVVDDYAAETRFFAVVSRELRARGTITAPLVGAV